MKQCQRVKNGEAIGFRSRWGGGGTHIHSTAETGGEEGCNNMCESLIWTPTVSIIDVKRSLFKKVIKYWLQQIEASMALMRIFRNIYIGIQHSKIDVKYVYIPKYNNEYFLTILT